MHMLIHRFWGILFAAGVTQLFLCRAGKNNTAARWGLKPWLITITAVLLMHVPAYGVNAADGVIERYAGSQAQVILEALPGGGEHEFEAEAQGGQLVVRGNTPIAQCRGFYTAVRHCGRGICSWSGWRSSPWTAQPTR